MPDEKELTGRQRRSLERIADRKSVPDFGALALLERDGFLEIKPASDGDDGMEFIITDAGRAALLKAGG